MKKQAFVAGITCILCVGLCILPLAAEAQEPAQQQESETKVKLTWQDNSKAMFDKVVQSSPEFIRPMSEKKLRETLEKKAGQTNTVTEDMVIEATKEVTPGPFVEQTLKDLEPLRTKKK